jgi:uncharacterized phage protein (TIGR01671 family)
MKYKFRGKRIDNGEWVHGGYCEFYVEYSIDESGETVESSPRLAHFIFMRNAIHEEVHPASVGMWTGLKDKNGMEIYEGDIMRNQAMALRVVKRTKYGEYRLFCGKSHSHFINGWMKGTVWEVIGSIHEKPELLE